jgi:hypothetical protein
LSIINWKRGDKTISINDTTLVFSEGILWICELPNNIGFCVVTLFDEATRDDISNALVYDWNGNLLKAIIITENSTVIRFLGCDASDDKFILDGADNQRYEINTKDWNVCKISYYR